MTSDYTAAFAIENARLAALATLEPIAQATPHHELTPHVWLSSQPGADAHLGLAPAPDGFVLRLDGAGQSPWVSLSYTVALETLREGRYIGLIAQVVSDGLFAFRPALRVLQDQGFRDTFAPQHMASSGGAHLLQGHIAIPHDQLDNSRGAEIHLFFSGDAFEARFEQLETLLMR